jgi:hypothetical protein
VLPSDIDIVWLYGYGRLIYGGGPMFYANGPKRVADRRSFCAERERRYHIAACSISREREKAFPRCTPRTEKTA